jgi:methylmalonyl-CoA mutase cobalamin-binding domain/chain
MSRQQELIDAISGMREEEALTLTGTMLEEGVEPLDVLEACRRAMEVIGQRFEEGDCFVPELILAGEVLQQITERVKPYFATEMAAPEKRGRVLIGTVEGDIHDIGKNIVTFMLDINGFDVLDIGVDVPPQRFVEAAKEFKPHVVGLSGFLTLAYEPMKDTVAALREANLSDVKVMIGGGQISERIRDYTEADGYGRDAMAAVSLANEWTGVE